MSLFRDLLTMLNLPLPLFLIVAPALAIPIFLPIGWHAFRCVERVEQGLQVFALPFAGLASPPLGWVHGMSLLLGFGGWL